MRFTRIVISFLFLVTFNSKGQHILCKSNYRGVVSDFFKRVGPIETQKYIKQGCLYDELKNLSKDNNIEYLINVISPWLSLRLIVEERHISLVERYIKTATEDGKYKEIEKLEQVKEKLVPYVKSWRETKDARISVATIKTAHTIPTLLNTVKTIAPIVSARCPALFDVIKN